MCEGEFIHAHRLVIDVAGMKELSAKRHPVRCPKRAFMTELNLAILVVIEIVLSQHRRKVETWGAEGFAGFFFSLLSHVIQRHLHRLTPGGKAQTRQHGKQKNRGHPAEVHSHAGMKAKNGLRSKAGEDFNNNDERGQTVRPALSRL